MQVTVETTEGLERRGKVQVPEDRVQGEVSKRLTNIAQSARLPGFRPGKAPMKVITQRYGKQVREEVVGELVQTSFQDAIAQESLRPAGTPTIDPLEWESGSGVAYTAVFDVYPEVSLPPIESLKVARPEAEVGDADLDRMLERLQTQRRTWSPVERAAATGARVVIDFEGVCDGEARDDLKAEGQIARVAVAQHAGPPGIGRQIAADPRRAFAAQRQREQAVDLSGFLLDVGQDHARLDGDGVVERIDLAHPVHPGEADDQFAAVLVGRGGTAKPRIATLRY